MAENPCVEVPHMSQTDSAAKYVKIWAILLVLLVVSILGPLFEVPMLTLITAFGIAMVKASLVAIHFMHLNVEKRYIRYMLYAMVLVIGLFFAGTAPDIMKTAGLRWENQAVFDLIKEHTTHESHSNHLP
jgi:caa(3)-type oxidase subunit IV